MDPAEQLLWNLFSYRKKIMDIKNARRKTFDVEFVEVTQENLLEVGDWCGGQIVLDDGSSHIKLATPNVVNNRQSNAYVGDFVLKSPTGFRSFSAKAFKNTFEILPNRNTLAKDEEIVPPVVASPTRVKASELGAPEPANLKEAMDRDAMQGGGIHD